jgi:hypothetical protein
MVTFDPVRRTPEEQLQYVLKRIPDNEKRISEMDHGNDL